MVKAMDKGDERDRKRGSENAPPPHYPGHV